MWPTTAIASFWIFLSLGSHACSPQKDAVQLSCPNDIELVADKNLATAFVVWDRNDFQITSKHPIKGLYQTVPINGASATVKRTFPEGSHYIEYKAVDSAGNYDECSFTVTVRVVQCTSMSNPQFGIVNCDSSNLYGSRCSISCIPGYVAVGPHTECLDDGQWSYDLAYCRMTTCSDPGTPLYGSRKCTTSTHAYGSVCEFDCSHGYQLVGNRRIVCQSVNNRTRWSEPAPVCQEIIPPRVEICLSTDVHVTAVGGQAEVSLPPIVFRTSAGSEAPFLCTFYGHDRSRNFSLGLHVVVCTATDPDFGERATAKCEFKIRVRANPCRAMAQPMNGFLLCSRIHGGGHDLTQKTTCRLFCDRGYVLPRSDYGPQSTVFECDHTGLWRPSSFVPSCVVPIRPLELKLPAELLFFSTNCSNPEHQNEVRTNFQSALLAVIRTHGACAMSPKDCIVDNVITDCHVTASRSRLSSSSSRRRRHSRRHHRRHHSQKGSSPSEGTSYDVVDDAVATAVDSLLSTGAFSFRRPRRSRTVVQKRAAAAPRKSFSLSVKFQLATRLPADGGEWPDEYHRATHRLYSLFDYFEQLVIGGEFSISHLVQSFQVEEVEDSVTYASIKTVCDIGYDFSREFLLCVPCGAGTYFNSTLDRCVQCPDGRRQAKVHCY